MLSNHSRLLSVLHMDNRAAQRFDSTEFSERKPFRKFDAVEPPFAVLIVGKRSGSIAPTFFSRGSNHPSLLSVFALDNTAAQRFDSATFSETLQKVWFYRTALHCPHCWKSQRFDGTLGKFSVPSNRRSLLSVSAMDDTAAQRFYSTNFYESTPFIKVAAVEQLRFVVCMCNSEHDNTRFGSTKFA